MNVFYKNPRWIMSPCYRHYTLPKMHDVSIDSLLPFIQKNSLTSNSNLTAYYMLLIVLHFLYKTSLHTSVSEHNSSSNILVAIILDVVFNRFFKPGFC